MAKLGLPEHMKEQRAPELISPDDAGPFITVSREYGCYGFSLGLLLLDVLNEQAAPGTAWQIYHKEILAKLASESNMAETILEDQRREKPRLIADFFRSLSKKKIPSGYEVRKRITTIIRGLAIEGHAIIIGQGGAGATQDLPNGISIRLEAPEDWRVKQVAFREELSEVEARLRIREMEREREYLRKIYETQFPRKPAFHLVYDCSVFTLAQIAQHVVYAMKLRNIL